MELTKEIKKSIDESVLCWLATASTEMVPNVSPKEIFTYYGKDSIIIGNIASPQSVKNIKSNSKACLSFIDILVQKGFQLKGSASILEKSEPDFSAMEEALIQMTGGLFPFETITKITVEEAKPILAPSYIFFPERTTEADQIAGAKKAYGL